MKFHRKTIITALLLTACILSGFILAGTPGYKPDYIRTHAELDSLIQHSLKSHNIPDTQVRMFMVRDDSLVHRKVYRVRVSPDFSKTSLHLTLHKQFYDLGFETPARVVFPERDMNIYLSYRGTILRTLRLITDDIQPEPGSTQEAENG